MVSIFRWEWIHHAIQDIHTAVLGSDNSVLPSGQHSHARYEKSSLQEKNSYLTHYVKTNNVLIDILVVPIIKKHIHV